MIKKLLMLAVALMAAHSIVAKEGDWYSINDFVFKYSMTDKVALYNRYTTILNNDMSDLYFGCVDIGLAYKFHKSWSAGAYYRHVQHDTGDEWETEHQPQLELTYGTKVKDIAISNRSRIEFRMYDFDKDDDIRFRNRTRAELPWGVAGIKPYFEEEFFYSDNAGEINSNWLTAGLYYKWSHVKLRAGYRWWAQKLSTGSWENRNALSTCLVVSF